MVNGVCGSRPGIGAVVRIWRRSGSTGRSTPTIAPSPRDQAPAAQTTVSVAIVPLSVTTRVIAPPLESIAVTAQSRTIRAPARRAAPAYPLTTLSGVQCPSVGEYAAARSPSVLISGRERLRLRDVDEPAGNAQLVLQGDVLLERLDVLRLFQQEEVADLVQVDLLAERLLERLERSQAASPELDVDPVGELGAHATGGLAGGTGPELALLDQDDVGDPGTEPGGRRC